MESWASFQVCMLKKQEPGSLGSTIRAPDRREGQGDTAGGVGGGGGSASITQTKATGTAWEPPLASIDSHFVGASLHTWHTMEGPALTSDS